MSTEPSPNQVPTIRNNGRLVWLAMAYAFVVPILGAASFSGMGFLIGLCAVVVWLCTFSSSSRPRAFVLACAALLTLAVLYDLTKPVVSFVQGAQVRVCRNHLHEIIVALHNYHDQYGQFPPAVVRDDRGEPLHSWRVLILPNLGQLPLYDGYDFTKPWDHPVNADLIREMPAVYGCPSHAGDGRRSQGLASYFLVTGERTAAPPSRGRRIKEVSDGTWNTVMLIESNNVSIHWTQPQDFTLDEALQELTTPRSIDETDHYGSTDFFTYPGYRHVTLMNGSVKRVADRTDRRTWGSLLTIDDGGPDLETLTLSPFNDPTPIILTWACATAFVCFALLPLAWVWRRPAAVRISSQPDSA